MSRKQRVLTSLHALESELLQAAKTGSKETLAVVLQSLAEIRDLCRRGLPESSYAVYGEIYDGLLLAIRQMTESEGSDLEQEALSLCQELVRHIIRETEREPNFKKDLFFLPYKASMWDSLESVWKAADADKEHCNAYVMPIPYCDRNPDGSAAEWHCERELFPKYVPTLDWREVDLKEWHPDVIFYHNPYDEYNRVTSVESRYYSRNLRECADKLVYIPYFVLEEPCTEEGVEHFVTTPGVWNADKVIVQSEAMRELYINILTKRTNQTDRAYWENRISGAGSPKIEKVLTSKKEDFDMPEKWRKLVEGRKVILYNTSLSAMLQHSDKVCDKLRYVFDTFRNRDDVVLWWRPHPLMKSTIHSMRPEIEEEYLSLEKRYIEEGWGIYDDSPDLHRAIAWSDAYYGDASSVAIIYKKARKPVLFQAVTMGVSTPTYICRMDGMGQYIYGLEMVRQVIVRINLRTARIDKIISIPDKYTEFWGYSCICKVVDKLIVLPLSKNKILEFDLDEQRFVEVVEIKNNYVYGGGGFSHCVVYKNYRYFTGPFSSIIVKYDVHTDGYTFLTDWFYLLKPFINYDSARHDYAADRELINNFCLVDGIVYFTIGCSNIVLEMCLEREIFFVHMVGDKDNKYQDIDFDGENFWLLQKHNLKIVKWNRENHMSETWDFSDACDKRKFGYRNIKCKKKYIEILPGKAHKHIMIDPNNKKIIQCKKSDKVPFFVLDMGNKMLIQCARSMMNDDVDVFEYCADNFWEISVTESNESCNTYSINTACLADILPPTVCFMENWELLLDRFLKGICHNEFQRDKKESSVFECGASIYQNISAE